MKVELRDVSEGSVLAEFPDAGEVDANRAAVALAERLSARRPRGILDAIPGARTLFVVFDPTATDREALSKRLRRIGEQPASSPPESRLFRIPVAYGGETGLDLPLLARDRGMDPEDLVRRHAAAEYTVAFLGFSPGFAYLTGLPPELASARRESPRPRVPAGSVAIGGEYTAIYPTESPGGWRLIGRSPVRFFEPAANPPALLRPGDRVRFERIDGEELERRLAKISTRENASAVVEGDPLFGTISPGLFTSAQGGPRFGLGASGVPAGGAMDLAALQRGNAILGNPPGAAALEMTLSGPELRVFADALVCVTGADLQARWNGTGVALEIPFEVKAGDHLVFGHARSGARAYLCVQGGLVERRPGEPLRRIARGDVVVRSGPAAGRRPPGWQAANIERDGNLDLRVLAGPQAVFFSGSAAELFFSATYRISPVSDRRGIRLDGPPLELRRPPDIAPEGTALGSIQVPASGLPIVLGPDRPVTGGYAKIGTVIARDWPLLAQAPPGTAVRFRSISLAEALEELIGGSKSQVLGSEGDRLP
jgi:KipI family sensor histidine kinase inhibitor